MKYYHTSNPHYRELILKEGLIPKQETWGKAFGSDMNIELGDTKAIFLKRNEPYDNGYDDDIYEVDVNGIINNLLEDKYIDNSFYTLNNIPPSRLKLIKKGSGESNY